MTNIDNLIAMLEDKAAGRKNEIGDVWGDWICDKAAAALREQRDEIAQLKAALAESCDERRTHLMHELGFPCPAEAERDAAMKDAERFKWMLEIGDGTYAPLMRQWNRTPNDCRAVIDAAIKGKP